MDMLIGRGADDHALRVAFQQLLQRAEAMDGENALELLCQGIVFFPEAHHLIQSLGTLGVVTGVDVPHAAYCRLHQSKKTGLPVSEDT